MQGVLSKRIVAAEVASDAMLRELIVGYLEDRGQEERLARDRDARFDSDALIRAGRVASRGPLGPRRLRGQS